MVNDPDNPGFMIPQVPANGIADSASLRGIWCAPALMERMTGIAISPSGQITGLLAGEQKVQSNASVDWIMDMSIPESSNYSGTIQWSVSALYTVDQMTSALNMGPDFAGAVKEVQMGTVALPIVDKNGDPIDYIMRKNGNNLEIELDGAEPPMTLVGTLRNNQIVFMSGNYVAMTVKLDPLMDIKISDFQPDTAVAPTVTTVADRLPAADILDNIPIANWRDFDPANDTNYAPQYAKYLNENYPYWKSAPPLTATDLTPEMIAAYEAMGSWTVTAGSALATWLASPPAPGTAYPGPLVDGDFTVPTPALTDANAKDAVTDLAAHLGAAWDWEVDFATYFTPNADAILDRLVTAGTVTIPTYEAAVTAGTAATYYNPATERDVTTYNPNPLQLQLFEQIKTTDKGGNVVIRGRTGGDYSANQAAYGTRNDVPSLWSGSEPPVGEVLQYGEFSFTLDNANVGLDGLEDYMDKNGFNEVIATAGADEEQAFIIGQMVLAKFQNAAGLMEAGTSIFQSTNNSGEPILVVPGLEGTGATAAGKLEMSNVDISKEFTDMITTQRGFQANTRIVTVSDEMLQELVNLKR
jgi:flagellar basal body rod protein FlgC